MASTAATLCCPLILMHNRPDRAYRDFWADFLADLQLSLAPVSYTHLDVYKRQV